MSDRQGVEIDYCPKCRGVWLDKGELDKIIERTADHYGGDSNKYSSDQSYRKDEYDQKYDKRYPNQPYRKKKGFLGDMFDFD